MALRTAEVRYREYMAAEKPRSGVVCRDPGTMKQAWKGRAGS